MAGSFIFVISHFNSICLAYQNYNRSGLLSSYGIQKPSLICYNSKRKLDIVSQIIDFLEGGPKLRKWYGAPSLTSKENEIPVDKDADTKVRDTVLVTNGDSEIGQMVILSLIVKQIKVKALVKDKQAAIEAFGTYAEPVVQKSNKPLPMKVLRGVRTIISPNEGFLSSNRNLGGVQHIILLSQLSVYRGFTGFQALMKSKLRDMAEQDEAIAMTSGIPYTIIKTGLLESNRSQKRGFSFEEGSAVKGCLSMEDAANICTEALEIVPQSGLIFEVANRENKVLNWKQHFISLIEKTGQQPL